MGEVESDEYLGDIIANNGKNTKNIQTRVAKGLGIVSHIIDLLKNVSFGKHFFEIARTLRESLFVNGLLTNCEVWHNLHESEINKLEEIDRLLLRKIFQVQSTCPAESLYLELGCIPLGIIIKTRRLNYLHHLVTRNEDEMIKKTFITQWNNPTKGDWSELVREDLKMFGMDEELSWIKAKSKNSFKAFLRSKANELALQILLNKKKNHSKMKNLHYSDLKIRAYLKNEKITIKEARALFKFRTRMITCWGNFKGEGPHKFASYAVSLQLLIHKNICLIVV